MTVLAGLWHFGGEHGGSPLDRSVGAMLAAQRGAGDPRGSRPQVLVAGPVALSDDGLLQPHDRSTEAGPLLAVDARIDNRDEVLDRLGQPRTASLDDAALFRLAYRHWGEAVVDHVLGDFAFVAWDPVRQVMTLARDPTGQRPLHYHLASGLLAAASLPQGLHALPGIPREPDLDRLRGFVVDGPGRGPGSFFRGIARVESGHVVRITRAGVEARRYWQRPTRTLQFRDPDDYVAAYREQLDRAVAARLRGAGDRVAAHLSAGFDSGAVAATAARLLAPAGGRVLAVTSAPRAAFAGPVPAGRIADESALAALVAARYPNIDHVVLRTGGASPLDLLDADARRFGQPVGYPCNNVWWSAANEAARTGGASIMLTGELGNLSLSAGGLGVLADYIRAGRLRAWLRAAVALERSGGPRWRGLLAASFGPWLPHRLLGQLRRFAAGGRASALDSLVAGPVPRLRPEAAATDERATRWNMLTATDPGNFRKGALLRWGIDERDPTADRRLIEFCFTLPPEQLVGGGMTRRLARVALADRLPPEILAGPRGYQFADWYEALDRDHLTAWSQRLARSPAAAAVVDFGAIDRLIDAWPPLDPASVDAIGRYRVGLLRALSAGAFALNAAA